MRRAETPLTFTDSLPANRRQGCWLPYAGVLLTLPARDGSHTVFTVHVNPWAKELAWNVERIKPPGLDDGWGEE